jgi:hypothetical protein
VTTRERTARQKGLGDLERRVGRALAEEITSRDDAGIDVLCEVEVDDSETWVSGWHLGHRRSRATWAGWLARWIEREGYLHDDELGETVIGKRERGVAVSVMRSTATVYESYFPLCVYPSSTASHQTTRPCPASDSCATSSSRLFSRLSYVDVY